MLSADFVTATGVAYVGLLFLIAYVSDRQARRTRASFLRSPFVYTLAISVYCTSWTFYGAVGSAARNGLEYLAIYLGPTLVFVGVVVMIVTSAPSATPSLTPMWPSPPSPTTAIFVPGPTPYWRSGE